MIKFEKMKVFVALVALVGFSMVFTSCDDDVVPPPTECPAPGPQIKLTVQPMFGTDELFLDSSYTTVEGYKVQFTDLKFYMEDIRNGSIPMIDAGLFDFRERGTLLLQTTGNASDFTSLQANLGVDAGINHDNPSEFATSSMLNISNSNDMHWGWNPGYIFVKIEGRADTIPDATDLFDHNIVFHAGLDVNLQTLEFTNLNWITIGTDSHELQFQLDMATFLQGSSQSIDLKTEYSSHSAAGQEALTLKVMENFKEALTPL